MVSSHRCVMMYLVSRGPLWLGVKGCVMCQGPLWLGVKGRVMK